ncbi:MULTISPECIES: hypothetical protein [Enterobacter]|jgi:hypothetical protein|uniref:Secreted protein n=2 Tax=Enterobacter ludwigii TaxID=299767 RepID=A0AAX3L814_9ENTR|nr:MULTISPECIES: hypothetical protein [Enterobacter]MCL6719447.1 hypothetical protein [Klebsiella sp. T2.Ur]AVO99514.1 hypothetical protein AM379_03590 [Enterobacter cloacae complex sp. FDA-CDC-AR_0132]EKS7199658.1 hypothetical protein [Enterobacter ludwigii]ELN9422988.1 hypothetical protein [Enterobacter ludwigii]MBQ0226721.1 hypothetical protein [Enterobacter ludwigii]
MMKTFLFISALTLFPALSCYAIAQETSLPLKEQIHTDEGTLCVYGDASRSEKVVMQGGNDCPQSKAAKQS